MKVLLFLGLIFMWSSCHLKTSADHQHEIKNLTTDSVLLQSLSSKAKALNLTEISKGVDSFELRIWHGMAIASPKRLMILKYQDSSWYLTNSDNWFDYEWIDGSPKRVLLDSSFTKSLKVPFNISSLVDSIYRFRLDTFPSQNEIRGFRDNVADGMFYQIELATSQYYKAVSYGNPNRYGDNYNRHITRLITMLRGIGVMSPNY